MTVAAFIGLGQMASAQYGASASAVTADGKTTVTYTGCTNGETITFTLGTATATAVCASGTAVASLATPAAGGTGTARGTTSPSVSFTVAAAPVVTTPGSGLPATGSSGISTTAGLAIGLLVVGLGLFVVAQVRRRQPSVA